jgi:hypothetical protein
MIETPKPKYTMTVIEEKLNALPTHAQQEAMDFIEFLSAKYRQEKNGNLNRSSDFAGAETPNVWDAFEKITKTIPESELAKLPTDGSLNHDKYLYGGK